VLKNLAALLRRHADGRDLPRYVPKMPLADALAIEASRAAGAKA